MTAILIVLALIGSCWAGYAAGAADTRMRLVARFQASQIRAVALAERWARTDERIRMIAEQMRNNEGGK